MISVTETSNRFISLLWRPINCNSSRASHLSHSKHSGGIPSSAASSLILHSRRHLYLERIVWASVQMFCSQYKSAGNNSPHHARPQCSCKPQSHQLFFLGAERRCSVSSQRRLWPLLLIHYCKWDHLAVMVRCNPLGWICSRFILLFIKWDILFRTPEERRDFLFPCFFFSMEGMY